VYVPKELRHCTDATRRKQLNDMISLWETKCAPTLAATHDVTVLKTDAVQQVLPPSLRGGELQVCKRCRNFKVGKAKLARVPCQYPKHWPWHQRLLSTLGKCCEAPGPGATRKRQQAQQLVALLTLPETMACSGEEDSSSCESDESGTANSSRRQ